MGAKINARITNQRSKNPVKPATPVKKRQTNRGDGVVGHVSRRIRGVASPFVRFIRTPHHRLLEDRHELGPAFFQPHHPHRLNMFRALAIDRRLQCICDGLGDDDPDENATNARARPESAQDKGRKNDDDQERFPNIGIAHRGHEQIERGIRPSLVDQMK